MTVSIKATRKQTDTYTWHIQFTEKHINHVNNNLINQAFDYISYKKAAFIKHVCRKLISPEELQIYKYGILPILKQKQSRLKIHKNLIKHSI